MKNSMGEKSAQKRENIVKAKPGFNIQTVAILLELRILTINLIVN